MICSKKIIFLKTTKTHFCSIHYVPNCSLILNLILVFAKVAYFDELLMIYFFILLDICVLWSF